MDISSYDDPSNNSSSADVSDPGVRPWADIPMNHVPGDGMAGAVGHVGQNVVQMNQPFHQGLLSPQFFDNGEYDG